MYQKSYINKTLANSIERIESALEQAKSGEGASYMTLESALSDLTKVSMAIIENDNEREENSKNIKKMLDNIA